MLRLNEVSCYRSDYQCLSSFALKLFIDAGVTIYSVSEFQSSIILWLEKWF